MSPTRLLAAVAAAGVASLLGVTSALADTVVVVTPTNTQGWSTADTRPGGTVTFVSDPTSPYPSGALQLTTDLTLTAKAQYLHAANTPLSQVTEASYWTRQVSAPFPGADPSYQLVVCLLGPPTATTCPGFTTLVYEPYQGGQGVVLPDAWQSWNTISGLYWSTKSRVCSNGVILGTPGGPATYTLAQVSASCRNAVVAGFGVNIGSNNPGWTVLTDGFNFNGTIYDFQLTNEPKSREDCKDGGWATLTDDQGNSFKNQGQCVSFFNHSGS